jgi:hypothetical protein
MSGFYLNMKKFYTTAENIYYPLKNIVSTLSWFISKKKNFILIWYVSNSWREHDYSTIHFVKHMAHSNVQTRILISDGWWEKEKHIKKYDETVGRIYIISNKFVPIEQITIQKKVKFFAIDCVSGSRKQYHFIHMSAAILCSPTVLET